MTRSSGLTGNVRRTSSQGSSCSHPQASRPTSRRRPPLPRRTSSEPRRPSGSPSASESVSWMRSPARPRACLNAALARAGLDFGAAPTGPAVHRPYRSPALPADRPGRQSVMPLVSTQKRVYCGSGSCCAAGTPPGAGRRGSRTPPASSPSGGGSQIGPERNPAFLYRRARHAVKRRRSLAVGAPGPASRNKRTSKF